jgi:hypothetical protein
MSGASLVQNASAIRNARSFEICIVHDHVDVRAGPGVLERVGIGS